MKKKDSKPNIFKEIRTQIIRGDLAPGDRLKETDLAAQFGMSRTPIREALHRLEVQGLLKRQPHRGLVVPTLDPQAVSELYVMREVLEGTAAKLTAQHATDIEIEALSAIVAKDKTQMDDPAFLNRSNRAFHSAIHRAAHNRFIVQALNVLEEANALLGQTTLNLKNRRAQSIKQHAMIIAAIKARDGEAAETAMREHMRQAFAARLTLLNKSVDGCND